jgi:hypothetical protein
MPLTKGETRISAGGNPNPGALSRRRQTRNCILPGSRSNFSTFCSWRHTAAVEVPSRGLAGNRRPW